MATFPYLISDQQRRSSLTSVNTMLEEPGDSSQFLLSDKHPLAPIRK